MWPFASPLTLNGWVSRTKPICWDLSGLGSPENQWSANRYPATIFDHVLTETVYRYRYPLHPFLFVKSVRRVVKLELIYANFILVAKSHMDPCSFYIISYIHTYIHTYIQTDIHTYIYIYMRCRQGLACPPPCHKLRCNGPIDLMSSHLLLLEPQKCLGARALPCCFLLHSHVEMQDY